MNKAHSALQTLQDRIETATGTDRALDADIEHILLGPSEDAPNYTGSVERCMDLLHAVLPDWHWHLGRDATGMMPFARLSKGNMTVSADGTTVPLVLLAATIKALREQEQRQGTPQR
ncbi:MAG: hypothetical protein ISR51_00975 [Rhodospirillales bacterium]|nr:hypothetical protein [Alphaproteobacteria bacterium]MBL6947224.1 hypothetical protein [Rhodospirillales bacterium]